MNFNINFNPQTWKKEVYIASKIDVSYDDEGNEIAVYGEPKLYEFNYQPVNSDAEFVEFGEKASIMKKVVIPITYQGKFKAFDVAYLDGVTPKNEKKYGNNANYRLLPPRDGNAVIIIYFEKCTGK